VRPLCQDVHLPAKTYAAVCCAVLTMLAFCQDVQYPVLMYTALCCAVLCWFRFVFERAKELGVRAIILDGPDK
jgi:hypothetical protein